MRDIVVILVQPLRRALVRRRSGGRRKKKQRVCSRRFLASKSSVHGDKLRGAVSIPKKTRERWTISIARAFGTLHPTPTVAGWQDLLLALLGRFPITVDEARHRASNSSIQHAAANFARKLLAQN